MGVFTPFRREYETLKAGFEAYKCSERERASPSSFNASELRGGGTLVNAPILAYSGCAYFLIGSPLRPWVGGGSQYDVEAVGCG